MFNLFRKNKTISDLNEDIERFESHYRSIVNENKKWRFRLDYLKSVSFGYKGGQRLYRWMRELEDFKDGTLPEEVVQGASKELIQYVLENGIKNFNRDGYIDEELIESHLFYDQTRKELNDWDSQFWRR